MIVYARNFNYYCSPLCRESLYDNKMHRPNTLLDVSRLVLHANALLTRARRLVGAKRNPRSLAFAVRAEHVDVPSSLFKPFIKTRIVCLVFSRSFQNADNVAITLRSERANRDTRSSSKVRESRR